MTPAAAQLPECDVFIHHGISFERTAFAIAAPLDPSRPDESLELSVSIRRGLQPKQRQILADYLSLAFEQIRLVAGAE